jgi:hypothetical protein
MERQDGLEERFAAFVATNRAFINLARAICALGAKRTKAGAAAFVVAAEDRSTMLQAHGRLERALDILAQEFTGLGSTAVDAPGCQAGPAECSRKGKDHGAGTPCIPADAQACTGVVVSESAACRPQSSQGIVSPPPPSSPDWVALAEACARLEAAVGRVEHAVNEWTRLMESSEEALREAGRLSELVQRSAMCQPETVDAGMDDEASSSRLLSRLRKLVCATIITANTAKQVLDEARTQTADRAAQLRHAAVKCREEKVRFLDALASWKKIQTDMDALTPAVVGMLKGLRPAYRDMLAALCL